MLVDSVLSCLAALRASFKPELRIRIGAHPRSMVSCRNSGFVVSERSVARYLRRIRRRVDPGKRWLMFLQSHRGAIVAFDFFTVPTVNFRLLYCFFVIEHHRRKIPHLNVTRHPSADWVAQQLRAAFPEAGSYRYVILM